MMKPFEVVTSKAIPLIRINVDTDAIIPSREMKRVSKRGLSEGLFAGWRYVSPDSRDLNPDFIMNKQEYQGSQILLSGDNFGCGSSREHAVWALHEYGIRVIIAPSFGAIFYKNCIRNGILPIQLSNEIIESFSGKEITVNLADQMVDEIPFEIATADKDMLLRGLDDIALNMEHMDQIKAFEDKDRKERPWAYLK